MITVYASIGNSDDKLSQERWGQFVRSFLSVIRASASQIHSEGHSSPTSAYQNLCVGFEIDEREAEDLRPFLADMAKRFGQDSIAWAVATTEFIAAAEVAR
jgi:hypothetical protein